MINKRFNIVYQKDAADCGIACIDMICKYYGMKSVRDILSNHQIITSEGVSLKAMNDVLRTIGFVVSAEKRALSQMMSIKKPCILHWNQNHFVLLYSSNHKYFVIADPSKGLIKYSTSEFKEHWVSDIEHQKGIVLFCKPTKDFHNNSIQYKKSYSALSSCQILIKYIKQYYKYFCYIVIGLLLGCILQLILPFLTQSIVDIGVTYQDVNFIWLILLGQITITFSYTAIDFIRRWLLLHISMRINISFVSDFFIKLLKLPMSFFDTKLMGDLLQRISDHSRVERFLTKELLSVTFSILSFVILGVVLCVYDKLIFCTFLLGSLIYGAWLMAFIKRRRVLDYEIFDKQAKNNNYTYQFITSMQEIKLQDCEQRRRWEWEDVQTELFEVQMKGLKLQQTQEAGSIFINEVKNIVITVLSATAVINGEMTLGMMLAVQYIIGQLNSPVEQLMSFIYTIQDVKIGLERINEVHLNDNEENNNRRITILNNDEYSITFSKVAFKYDPHALNNTIENINFDIPQGKVTAIVGASGSGKTTLIKLMLGYYPTLSGDIIIAGENLNNYNLKWWRRQCGVVMQDGVIFSESIARNIAVDDGEIDKERLVKAAEIANIHECIMGLPLKYNTKIGRDGVGLSQGQKQRILIARAVYKNPQFIFLDEATNALDAKNERAIVENLNEFYKGRTVVVVAHRLSTVKNADQIVVLDAGKVVEVGDHNTLIAKQGTYYNLVKNQLELGN